MIKLVQTCSNLFKLDLNGSMQFKIDQACSNLIKHAQTWSNMFKLDQMVSNASEKNCETLKVAWVLARYFDQKCLFGQKSLFCQIWLFGKKLVFGQKWQWVRIELISYILARIVFKSEITFLPEMAFLPKTAFQPWLAFWPKILLSVLNWLFGQIWLKSLTFQSIERFGSPLMAESFQACFPTSIDQCKSFGLPT